MTNQAIERIFGAFPKPNFEYPPPTWDADELALKMFFYASDQNIMGLTANAYQLFYAHEITGRNWFSMQANDFEDLGFTKGKAMTHHSHLRTFLQSYSDPPSLVNGGGGTADVFPYIVLRRLVQVNSPDYIEIELDVSLVWEDNRIFKDCETYLGDSSDPVCEMFWQPKLTWPTAILSDVEIVKDFGLTTASSSGQTSYNGLPRPSRSFGFRAYVMRAKFIEVLDYKNIPFDEQQIEIPMLVGGAQSSDRVCFRTVGLEDATFVNISSRVYHPLWRVISFTASSFMEATNPVYFLQPSEAAKNSFPHFKWMEETKISNPSIWSSMIGMGNTDGRPPSLTCGVLYTINVIRQNQYHIWNFILIEVLLVLLGWCTFFISPDNVDSRISISLTLLLAINVFQIVLVENLPEVGYLTNLQMFTILNTFLLGCICAESMIVKLARECELSHAEKEKRMRILSNKPEVRSATRVLQRAWRNILFTRKGNDTMVSIKAMGGEGAERQRLAQEAFGAKIATPQPIVPSDLEISSASYAPTIGDVDHVYPVTHDGSGISRPPPKTAVGRKSFFEWCCGYGSRRAQFARSLHLYRGRRVLRVAGLISKYADMMSATLIFPIFLGLNILSITSRW